ncbi:MAG: hypothetical protein ACLFTR_04450 [Candidatus Woesearchaeota archaeon]
MGEEISITYEKLFDISRKEKGSEELQKLDKNFYTDLIGYINDKSSIIHSKNDNTVFSKSEKEITSKQMENIKKLVNDLYMRREQKIVNLAVMKSRTNSGLIDTSAMLEEEKRFFDNLLEVLKDYKQSVVFQVLSGAAPKMPAEVQLKHQEKEKEEKKVRIELTDDVPRFIGKEMESYGPFSQGNTADLPEQIANILINKGRAKKIE